MFDPPQAETGSKIHCTRIVHMLVTHARSPSPSVFLRPFVLPETESCEMKVYFGVAKGVFQNCSPDFVWKAPKAERSFDIVIAD